MSYAGLKQSSLVQHAKCCSSLHVHLLVHSPCSSSCQGPNTVRRAIKERCNGCHSCQYAHWPDSPALDWLRIPEQAGVVSLGITSLLPAPSINDHMRSILNKSRKTRCFIFTGMHKTKSSNQLVPRYLFLWPSTAATHSHWMDLQATAPLQRSTLRMSRTSPAMASM